MRFGNKGRAAPEEKLHHINAPSDSPATVTLNRPAGEFGGVPRIWQRSGQRNSIGPFAGGQPDGTCAADFGGVSLIRDQDSQLILDKFQQSHPDATFALSSVGLSWT